MGKRSRKNVVVFAGFRSQPAELLQERESLWENCHAPLGFILVAGKFERTDYHALPGS
jgi:hypothetical protein